MRWHHFKITYYENRINNKKIINKSKKETEEFLPPEETLRRLILFVYKASRPFYFGLGGV